MAVATACTSATGRTSSGCSTTDGATGSTAANGEDNVVYYGSRDAHDELADCENVYIG